MAAHGKSMPGQGIESLFGKVKHLRWRTAGQRQKRDSSKTLALRSNSKNSFCPSENNCLTFLLEAFTVCVERQDQERGSGYMDRVWLPRQESSCSCFFFFFLRFWGKENHFYFIMYLLLNNPVELGLKTTAAIG